MSYLVARTTRGIFRDLMTSSTPPPAPGPTPVRGIKRILGAVTTIANGLAELRNRGHGHGTGHGPATARVGPRPRHAHLAVNAAITWCRLMLDTLADPDAPWRRQPPAPASAVAEPTAGGQPPLAAGRAAAAPAR